MKFARKICIVSINLRKAVFFHRFFCVFFFLCVNRVLVYPPAPTKGGIVVHRVDLDCLDEGELLNDVIIDFYIK